MHFPPATSSSGALGVAIAAVLLGFVGEQLPEMARHRLSHHVGSDVHVGGHAHAHAHAAPQRAWHPQCC